MTDLLSLGQPVTLANGEVRRLRFGMKELVQLERRFDSLQKFMDSLRERPFGTLAAVFAIVFHVTEDEAMELVDPKRLNAYFDAISGEIVASVGEPSEGEAKAPETAQSPGSASTTSGSSSSASAPSSSGE